MSNEGRFIDRLPIVCPAGIKSNKDDDVSNCLRQYNVEDVAEILVKSTEPKKCIPPRPQLVRTALFEDSIPQTIQPDVDSFTEFEKESMEARFYKVVPLAKTKKFNTVPPHVYNNDLPFPEKRDSESLYNLVLPPKKVADVLRESQAGHDLYLTTHGDYNPSEQVRRGYGPPFNRNKCFGIYGGVDSSGAQVRRALDTCDSGYVFKNSIQDEVERRKKTEVGKTLDRTGSYCNLKNDNTAFNLAEPRKWEFSRVRLLIYNKTYCPLRNNMYNAIAYINTIRRKIKKRTHFAALNVLRLNIKKVWYTWEEVYEMLNKYNIHLDFERIKIITDYLKLINDENKVDMSKLVDLVDILVPLPVFGQVEKYAPQEPSKLTTYREMITDSWRHGCSDADVVPADAYLLSKPKISTQYLKTMIGDLPEETTVKSLISPSIPTKYGLSHRDYLLPRNKEDIRALFTKADFEFTEEEFEECWEEAKKEWSSSGDKVSVEAFMFRLGKQWEAKNQKKP